MTEKLKLKQGDIVHVRCVVSDTAPMHGTLVAVGFRAIEPGAAPLNFAVLRDDIVKVEPRPLKAGHRVRTVDGGISIHGVVLAADDNDRVWVRWENGIYATRFGPDLERVP